MMQAGSGKALCYPCGRPCGDLCPCLEKVDNRPPGTLPALFGADLAKTARKPC